MGIGFLRFNPLLTEHVTSTARYSVDLATIFLSDISVSFANFELAEKPRWFA